MEERVADIIERYGPMSMQAINAMKMFERLNKLERRENA